MFQSHFILTKEQEKKSFIAYFVTLLVSNMSHIIFSQTF